MVNSRSVSVTARSIKLPEFLVDLRHEATDCLLPNMFLLAKAVQELLNWLYQEYWTKQFEYLVEKTETIIKDIDRFERRARVTTDTGVLAKVAEGMFKPKIECYKQKIGNIVAEPRWKMQDEAWALMFLQLQSKNKKFGEGVMQGMLRLLKNSEIRVDQAHIAFHEVLTLAQSLCISYTPWVKNLLILQNTDAGAFALVSAMLKANAFPGPIKQV